MDERLDQRLREAEALNLLTNRILMDFLSLQIDAGSAALDGVKALVAFSAAEVVRGSPVLNTEVRYFERVMLNRFDETFSSEAT
jgi:hypothetical protein